MTWTSWRLARPAAVGTCAIVALLGVYLLIAAHELRTTFDTSGLVSCLGSGGNRASCPDAALTFYKLRNSLTGAGPVAAYVGILSGLLGLFIGAPVLARESETGTYRLAWTQSISRTRWLASRILIAGAVVVAAEIALTALMTYWRHPSDLLDGRFETTGFDVEGIAPLGYAVFAFTLGVLAGAIIRRTAAALAATFAAFMAVRLVIENLLRPHFLRPLTLTYVGNPPPRVPSGALGDWILEQHAPRPGSGFPTVIIYQPSDRFWTFQLMETGILLVLTATFLTVTFAWTKRMTR